jgi:hypothetical protein
MQHAQKPTANHVSPTLQHTSTEPCPEELDTELAGKSCECICVPICALCDQCSVLFCALCALCSLCSCICVPICAPLCSSLCAICSVSLYSLLLLLILYSVLCALCAHVYAFLSILYLYALCSALSVPSVLSAAANSVLCDQCSVLFCALRTLSPLPSPPSLLSALSSFLYPLQQSLLCSVTFCPYSLLICARCRACCLFCIRVYPFIPIRFAFHSKSLLSTLHPHSLTPLTLSHSTTL